MKLPGDYRIIKVAAVALGLGLSMASPEPAKAGGLADLFLSSRVTQGCSQFVGPFGVPVPVAHYLPKNNCANPAVVIFHGSDGVTRYQDSYDEIGKGLAAKGYAAFIVYYFEGAPGFQRPGPMDKSLPDVRAFEPWKETAEAAVDYVRSMPCVDGNRVGVMGMSLGGYIGTSVAANDTRIKSLIVLSGGMPDEFEVPMKWMPPTLIVHGDQDPDVPVQEAFKLHHCLSRKGIPNTLRILPCEGHLPYRVHKETVAEQVLCFLDSTL